MVVFCGFASGLVTPRKEGLGKVALEGAEERGHPLMAGLGKEGILDRRAIASMLSSCSLANPMAWVMDEG